MMPAGNNLDQRLCKPGLPGPTLKSVKGLVDPCGNHCVPLVSQTRGVDPLVVHTGLGVVLHASNEEGCRLSALALRIVFAKRSEPTAVLTSEVANGDISQVD
jgi:hypothetical protein